MGTLTHKALIHEYLLYSYVQQALLNKVSFSSVIIENFMKLRID